MPFLSIIDYGMGNLRSVQKGFERVGVQAEVTRDARRIESAEGVILPGVGAFGACMENLRRFDLVDTVKRVIDRGKPFLGICLGLQLLFDQSEEFGPVEGLGIFRGRDEKQDPFLVFQEQIFGVTAGYRPPERARLLHRKQGWMRNGLVAYPKPIQKVE